MALEKWLIERINLAVNEAIDKVKQFALEAVVGTSSDELTEIREEFARVGVWALQNPLPILKAMYYGKPFTVLIGMRPLSTFHLGHLTLMRELNWLIKRGGYPIFLFASYEADKFISAQDAELEMVRFGKVFLKFTGTLLPKTVMSFSDRDSLKLQALEDRSAKHLTVRKILQLYGWDKNASIALLRIPVITVAAILFPTVLFPEYPTLVLSDIHQITHAEVVKIVARQLKFPSPSYSYRILLPSLEGPTERMSMKNSRSVIFINEAHEQIVNKLRRSFSGGCLTSKEQRIQGGNPHICSFFRIGEILRSYAETAQVYQECVSGALLCSECKQKYVSMLAKRICKLFES